MNPLELKSIIDRRPFEPIRLHITGGETVDITHPDAAVVGRSAVYVGQGRSPEGIVERMTWYNLIHIVKIEPLNGQQRRRRSA